MPDMGVLCASPVCFYCLLLQKYCLLYCEKYRGKGSRLDYTSEKGKKEQYEQKQKQLQQEQRETNDLKFKMFNCPLHIPLPSLLTSSPLLALSCLAPPCNTFP
jgi:hypothetical protein